MALISIKQTWKTITFMLLHDEETKLRIPLHATLGSTIKSC
jgi:hypothetical protein